MIVAIRRNLLKDIGKAKTNMKSTQPTKWCLLAAVAALPMLMTVSTSLAQDRVGGDGRLLDANNRVGSGGSNDDQGNRQVQQATGNDIVNGNVTGGREFRGNVPYSDPRAFRGNTAGTDVDRFIARSSGAPQAYSNNNAYTNGGQAFYGSSRGVNAPMGSQEIGSTGAYVPAPDVTQRQIGDQRLGDVLGVPQSSMPQSGTYLPGQVDTSGYQTNSFTGNSLYGMPNSAANGLNTGNAANTGNSRDQKLSLMRQELNESANSADLTGTSLTDPTGADSTSIDASTTPKPLNGSTDTNQSLRQNVALPAAVKQSSQYAELQRRLEKTRGGREMTDVEASREANELRRLRDQQNGKLPAPGATPGTGTTPGQAAPGQGNTPTTPGTVTPANPRIPAPTPSTPEALKATGPLVVPQDKQTEEPLVIKSLADGIKAQGLHDLLVKAEQDVREGRFLAALDGYATAEQVAPNNPLVQIGKAHALLGGSYFARAEVTIRQAFAGDPALLMAKFDLRGMIGEDRLTRLVKDLKIIANAEQNDPQALFLLAYIAYNTGSEQQAGQYLQAAAQRYKTPDPVITAMQKYWKLSATSAPVDGAK